MGDGGGEAESIKPAPRAAINSSKGLQFHVWADIELAAGGGEGVGGAGQVAGSVTCVCESALRVAARRL